MKRSNIDIIKDYVDGKRPFVKVGWTPDSINRKDGETWVDATGNSWIFKNGRKKRINKKYKIDPEDIRMRCKDCNMDMKWGKKLDDVIFPKTGRCYDCNIKFETLLKVKGLYKDYITYKSLKSQESFCKELKSMLEESINHIENRSEDIVYFNSDGSQEIWKDENKHILLESVKNDYDECLKAIDRISESLKNINFNENSLKRL